MVTRAQQTTIPARDSSASKHRRTVTAIRWGFPDPEHAPSILGAKTVVLGRDEGCEIRLPGKELSRRHAEIRYLSPGHVIKDLDSRNGVFVEGVRVDEAPLALGQIVRLGEWIGTVVEIADDVAEPVPVFDILVGDLAGGPVLRPILERARLAASSNLPAVILGETGTGKEGLSRAIHTWSGRQGPFVAVNCATLVPTLAEAELFGHRKGAFTGAEHANMGYFRAAHGGTLLLDEIADIPEVVQAKLLRVLQQGEIHPLGENRPVPVDVRVLAATQVSLTELVAQRRFRGDLCARLDGLTIRIPPLRDRREEIPYLFSHLLRRHAKAVPDVEVRLVEQLCLYDWPFNVRELDLLVRQLLVLHGKEPLLRRSFLPDQIIGPKNALNDKAVAEAAQPTASPNTAEYHRARREAEMAALSEAMRVHGGSISRAAGAIGISRQRAYRLIEAFGEGRGKSRATEESAD